MKIRGNTIGTTMKPDQTLVKAQNLTPQQKSQARENIGAMEYIVKVIMNEDETGYVIDGDFDWDALVDAATNNRRVVCRVQYNSEMECDDTPYFHPLSYVYLEDDYAVFGICGEKSQQWVIINHEGEVRVQSCTLVSFEQLYEVSSKLVDIETALDSILAIQNALIGGAAE